MLRDWGAEREAVNKKKRRKRKRKRKDMFLKQNKENLGYEKKTKCADIMSLKKSKTQILYINNLLLPVLNCLA